MIDDMCIAIRRGIVYLEVNEVLRKRVYVLNRVTTAEKTYVEFHEWYEEEWPEMEKFFKSDKGQEFLLDVCRRGVAFRKFLENEYGDGVSSAELVLSQGMVDEVNKGLENEL